MVPLVKKFVQMVKMAIPLLQKVQMLPTIEPMVPLVKKLVQMVKMVIPLLQKVQMLPTNGNIGKEIGSNCKNGNTIVAKGTNVKPRLHLPYD